MVFGYSGKQIIDEPTAITILFACVATDPFNPLSRSFICAYFPAIFIAENGFDILLDISKRWASMIDMLLRNADDSLLFEHGIFSDGNAADITVLPALKHFLGLDFSDPSHLEVESDLGGWVVDQVD